MAKENEQYFGCWMYREKADDSIKTILSLSNNESDILKFPYESKFGKRVKGKLKLFNKLAFVDMFGAASFSFNNGANPGIGYSFMYGGKIIDDIPSYWVGGDIKEPSKNIDDLRSDLEKFCYFTET